MTSRGIVRKMVQLAVLLAFPAACGAVEREPAALPEPPGGDRMAHQSIPQMQGCYAISYQFVGDGEHDFLLSGVVEYIDMKEQAGGYVFRHFMVDDKTAFHHFTEEWTPVGDGRWRQRVMSAQTGKIRYEAIGSWRFNQWEGSATGAAKPVVRDTKLKYSTLDRRSTLQITKPRWVYAENNTKRLEDGTPIATEVGWVQYERLDDDAQCAPGIELSKQTR